MKNRIIITTLGIITLLALMFGDVMNTILSLFLLGIIPGTSLVIPYWVMMVGYCLIITAIVTLWVEHVVVLHRTIVRSPAKSRPIHRRYSHS